MFLRIERTLNVDHCSYTDCLTSSQSGSDALHYFLRIKDDTIISNPNGKCYAGNRVEYELLREYNITASTLFNWSIPIDVCDDY